MNDAGSIVYVVDDDQLFRRSTERLIRTAGLNVQPFSSARDFLSNPKAEGPSCLVLDVRMPGLNGMDLQREMTQMGIDIPIIFITGHGDIPMSVRAMKAGAAEFLTKPFRSSVLLNAIHAAIERDRASIQKKSATKELRDRYEKLTPREREVMTLVADGLLNKEVAGKLSTAEATIKFHRAHIMRKMCAKTIADLIRMSERLGPVNRL